MTFVTWYNIHMKENIWHESISLAKQLITEPGSIHVAMIYKRNRLISIGRNNREVDNAKVVYYATKYQIEEWKKYPRIHAEIDAISKAWKLHYLDSSYTIISLRIARLKGKARFGLYMAKPCKNCSKVIAALGCKVIYSNRLGQYEEL